MHGECGPSPNRGHPGQPSRVLRQHPHVVCWSANNLQWSQSSQRRPRTTNASVFRKTKWRAGHRPCPLVLVRRAEEVAGDDLPLDLGRALVDARRAHFAIEVLEEMAMFERDG